ncbi:MAG: hypothetical protein JNL72_06665 [Flavipsychrobacter sp.]|nr:hypothetical protein [Flavipsychrobacter sp.]
MANQQKIAKWAGSLYFIALGVINLAVSYRQGQAGWKDLVLLAFLSTPLVVNRKIYYLLFGGLLFVLSLYVLYTVFNTQTMYVRGVYEYHNTTFSPAMAFSLGYAFAAVSLFFSYLLLRTGLKGSAAKPVS